MSLSVVFSRAANGTDAPVVAVETHLSSGLPAFNIVGLPETAVRESRDRVRGAILNSGFEFPRGRITVNLAPADLPKQGGRFDLPIALGILVAGQQVRREDIDRFVFLGELALGGRLRPVQGALVTALSLRGSDQTLVLPRESAGEATLVRNLEVLEAGSLGEIAAALNGIQALDRAAPPTLPPGPEAPDLRDVAGQPFARRALETAAAGFHSMLMIGPPGTGKTMLASRLPGILPPMNESEALESAALQSLSGPGFNPANWQRRAFRSPHHSASAVALVGGGSVPRPGEVSLAHGGVLFLDELAEFDRHVLETLREPIENGHITVSRAARQTTFPCRCLLIAATNPCPCGYRGDGSSRCRCTPERIDRYLGRLSGPLIDRFDLHVEVSRPEQGALISPRTGNESSESVRQRVIRAYERQIDRQGRANAHLPVQDIERWCRPDGEGIALLERASTRFSLSARSCHGILKLARTLADLGEIETPGAEQVAAAIQLRQFDRTKSALI